MSLPAHEVTTAHLGAAYPFMSSPSLGPNGVYIGQDLLGGAFSYDPFDLYERGILTNANMIVLGQIGRGKSSFVKSYLWRQSVFGRQSWIVDPKGEYGALARAWGVEPIKLRPGGSICLNPLEHFASQAASQAATQSASQGVGGNQGEHERRCVELLVGLSSSCLGRTLLPTEHAAAELAVRSLVASGRGSLTLVDVVGALLNPSTDSAEQINTDAESLTLMGRDLALELRRLVEGDLRGMFDGPTSPGIELNSPFVVLDLSSVYRSAALGALMTCATAWLSASLKVEDGVKRFIVIDEAWAILNNLGVARWLQSSWKLSRSMGVSNLAVLHRLSDLKSVGQSGSEQSYLASGLLSDSETRVVYSQPKSEIQECGDLIGLSSTEAQLLPTLRRGVALWKVGSRSFLVDHRLGRHEHELVDTDSRMR